MLFHVEFRNYKSSKHFSDPVENLSNRNSFLWWNASDKFSETQNKTNNSVIHLQTHLTTRFYEYL